MKLLAGVVNASADPTNFQFPAPANGHYENIQLLLTVSGEEPSLIYFGTVGRQTDFQISTESGLVWSPNIKANGVIMTTVEVETPGGTVIRMYRQHFGNKKVRVTMGQLLTVRYESDAAPTNCNFILTADFIPYKGSAYSVTLMDNTTSPEATNYGPKASIFPAISLINARLEIQWIVNDASAFAMIMKVKKFRTRNLIVHNLTESLGDVIDVGDDVEGVYVQGDIIGRLTIDTTTGLSGRGVIPVGTVYHGERCAWDFQEIVGSGVDVFQLYVTLRGTVKDRHYSKAGKFWNSTFYQDLSQYQGGV